MRHRVLLAFYGLSAAVSLLAALVCLLLPQALPAPVRLGLMAIYGGWAAACAAATRAPAVRADRLLGPMTLVLLAVIGSLSALSGWGLAAPGMVFVALAVGLVCAVARRTVANTIVAGALVVVGAVALADAWQLLPGPPRADSVPLALRLVMGWAAVAAAGAGGRALAGLMARHQAVAAGRERRFQKLLAIAAAVYWETDAQLQLRHVSRRNRQGDFVPLPEVVGLPIWELAALQADEDVIDGLRADMEARSPLSDLPFSWQDDDGRVFRFLASGQPRLDARGRLLGYWGVARDVTLEHDAQAALLSTERRYQDLFLCLPTPLLLHRGGRVIDANPAAAALLGHGSVAALLGRDVVAEHIVAEDQGAARDRVARLARMEAGGVLPPAALRMRTVAGEVLHVQAMVTRTDGAADPALLSMVVDQTASVLAAQSQQQAEALFAQVLSISPDIITLTDLDTGHYLMVNDSFTRVTGYRSDEVVGRSAQALGIWRRPADREALLALLSERDTAENLTVEFVAKHGGVVPLLVSASRFARDGRQLLVINAREVTEAARLRLEREAILANASVGIAFTRQRRFVMVNPHFERIYGWPPGELIGRAARVVWADDLAYEALGEVLGPALRRGEAVQIEREAQRRDGSQFLVRLRAKALDPLHPGDHGTIWIAEDVTHERQAEQALARARDAAEAASRAKSAFLANTSHEIRTPLNGLLGLARLARQPGVPAQRQRDYLDQIADSAETLSMVISDILDLSKIEAGKLEVVAAPFDLRELLHGLQRAYAALAASHGLAFALALDQAVPARVLGDALRTRQILANFLHNALKFTASGSIRLVAHWRADGPMRFEVHDSGPGIDSDTQARLFQPFTQADDSTTRRYGGTGLGLSICHQLAALMGGRVGVVSSPGQGSCFFAELPLPAAEVASAAAPDAPLDDHRLRGARVLLVEDNPVNMMVAAAMLEQWQVQVTQATDGHAALDAVAGATAAGLPFQAVLMDVQMPDISGYEATVRLRAEHDARQLPVIALTAAALVSERQRALAAGMTDFVTKPIDPRRLREALLHALA